MNDVDLYGMKNTDGIYWFVSIKNVFKKNNKKKYKNAIFNTMKVRLYSKIT